MVVDNVDDHGDAYGMSGVNEPLEAGESTVAVLDGVGVDAVVAPIAFAGKLGQRHELDGVDAQFMQVIEFLNDALEVVGSGEGTGMQFVDDTVAEGKAFPAAVVPGESLDVDDFGERVYAFRLTERCGVGERFGIRVETKAVAGTGTGREGCPPVAGGVLFHEMKRFGWRCQQEFYFSPERGPEYEFGIPTVKPGAGFLQKCNHASIREKRVPWGMRKKFPMDVPSG
jgi:hypothetical protein